MPLDGGNPRRARCNAYIANLGNFFILRGTTVKSDDATVSVPQFSHNFGTTQVLISNTELSPGQKITMQDIKIKDWPNESVPEESLKVAEEAVGKYIKYTYPSGIPLRRKDIASQPLTEVLEPFPDQRGVSVTLDERCAVEGFITAGRYVDIIYTYRNPQGTGNETTILVENSRGLSLNKNPLPVRDFKATEPKAFQSPGVYTATLSASPEDVNKIILAQTDGKLCFSLRGTGAVGGSATGVINSEDLKPVKHVPPPSQENSKCNQKAFIKDKDKTIISECNSKPKELEDPI